MFQILSSAGRTNFPFHPQYLLFLDLDETLVDNQNFNPIWIKKLESLLLDLYDRKIALFGILTGCNYLEAQNKICKCGLSIKPDFISVGFGTEIYYSPDKESYIIDKGWQNNISKSYSKSEVNLIIDCLNQFGIHLEEEKRSFNILKDSYFYYENTNSKYDLKIIRNLSRKHKLKVIISKCNPDIGDPADAYDIDFIPNQCGKEKIAHYLLKKFQVKKNNVFAFGDSKNDLNLLKYVGHGYAVSNATPELMSYQINTCAYDHSHGIYYVLKDFFNFI